MLDRKYVLHKLEFFSTTLLLISGKSFYVQWPNEVTLTQYTW